MQPFTAQVIEIIKSIPEGKVMTYGQVAALAGSPRAARQVVRILHSMSEKHRLPWHRVVNKQGEIALSDEWHRSLQQSLLEEEGVYLNLSKRIDLTIYQA
ncbi:MGMT family protein [Paenibacillus sp. Marseille-Q4541]|uniref:MGMT family protein n=1 Tax=Paenibacillus sp. Marseille-Q4541 TaxID=2831522 RepID=UPI001BA61273|nr:MGMT family protein [Paenibacillus sp. Marseille-Q4541]